jgi:hypothetical protein
MAGNLTATHVIVLVALPGEFLLRSKRKGRVYKGSDQEREADANRRQQCLGHHSLRDKPVVLIACCR